MPTAFTRSSKGAADGSAVFSECMSYRYLLTRRFDTRTGSCLFVMLNPSTADATCDDPTIRRCVGFVKRWGKAELRVVNLFALRTVDPRELKWSTDLVGPENDAMIRRELAASNCVVAGWGNLGAMHGRSVQIRTMISMLGVRVKHLGLNTGGEPGHPLYVSGDTTPGRMP